MRRRRLLEALAVPAVCAVPPLAAAETKRGMNDWYYADALAIPPNATLDAPIHGAHGFSLEWMIIFNLSDKESTATVTHYLEEAAPVEKTVKLPARAIVSVGGHGELPEELQPKKKLYGVRVQTSVPVVVQATRAEQEFGTKPPTMPGRSFLSRLGYEGPLGKRETAWAYCDCFIQRKNKNAVETEWLTILNPSKKDAKIKISFNYVKAGQSKHETVIPAERVRTFALADLEAAKDATHAGVLVESSVPVVVDQVRRYWYRWRPAPAGTWIAMARPVGDLNIKLPSAP